MDQGGTMSATQGPPNKRRKVAAAAPTGRDPTITDMLVSPHHGDKHALPPALDRLPVEVVFEVLSWLPGRALAAVACTCRAVEAVARDSRLWEAAYRRDIAPTGPPAEHADYAAHGKDMRWLYGLMGAAPGRMREGPAGVLTGRLIAADGITRRSGEFVVVASDNPEGDATLRLDGYGAIVTKDVGNGDADTLCTVQGKCFGGRFVGRLTIQWLDASAYASGLAATRVYRGDVSRPGDDVAQGEDAIGKIRVLGGRALDGRCVSTVIVPGCVYAGHCDDGVPGVSGAVRLSDGTVREYWSHVPSDRDRNAHWCIERPADKCAPVTRVAYDILVDDREDNGRAATRVTLATHHDVSRCRRRDRSDFEATTALGDGLFVTGPCTRVCYAGHVLVWIGSEPLFLAVSHRHADRRIAGLRLLGDNLIIRSLLELVDGTVPSLDHLVTLDRANADAVTKALDRASFILENAQDIDRLLQGRCLSDEPFGVVINDSTGRPWVRCFLTGRRVEAKSCAFFTTGRLYESHALEQWMNTTEHCPSDPESGESVVGNALRIMWAPWMASIPSDVLEATVAHTISSTHISTTSGNKSVADRAANDIVRLRLLQATRATRNLPPRDIALVVAHAISSWESRCRAATDNDGRTDACVESIDDTIDRADDDHGHSDSDHCSSDDGDEAVRGFDIVSLRHVELHDPAWDLRGDWRSGPVSTLFDDPTLAEHERHLLDNTHKGGAPDVTVQPDAHLDSHGVLRVALHKPSFVGARLVGVFFVGHHFDEASFVGAVLDRCAFVHCTFHHCAMTAATLLHCGFWNCGRVVGADTKPLTARKVDKIVRTHGGLL
ncbi:F-box domain containing protein [Pandoravirus celtis]|uniref:F-box domain containing protein n=1 Tax=Pandoravirus celtis TaxID=2568002 RepID=A0A4D6EIQ5_9VIRU|nr:F-box domain containing protein [Pandoravirus celtis]